MNAMTHYWQGNIWFHFEPGTKAYTLMSSLEITTTNVAKKHSVIKQPCDLVVNPGKEVLI